MSVPGFYLGVYDTTGVVLAEADGNGSVSMSGLALEVPHNDDPDCFYGEPMPVGRYWINFSVLPLQDIVDRYSSRPDGFIMVQHDYLAQQLYRLLGGMNAEFCDNLTSVDTLIRHKPLEADGGQDLYFEWPPGDRG